jgi:hypothetical protein
MPIHLLNPNWLMVSNTLLIEEDLGWKAPAHDFVYRNRHGLIVMCANCRSSQRRDDPRQWDFCSVHLKIPPASLGPCWSLPHLSRLFLSADSVTAPKKRKSDWEQARFLQVLALWSTSPGSRKSPRGANQMYNTAVQEKFGFRQETPSETGFLGNSKPTTDDQNAVSSPAQVSAIQRFGSRRGA